MSQILRKPQKGIEIGKVREYYLSTQSKGCHSLSLSIQQNEGRGHWSLWLKLLSAHSQVFSLVSTPYQYGICPVPNQENITKKIESYSYQIFEP